MRTGMAVGARVPATSSSGPPGRLMRSRRRSPHWTAARIRQQRLTQVHAMREANPEPVGDLESCAWWRELETWAQRLGPTIDARNGLCPCCRQGARQPVPLSGVPWFLCSLCGFAWALRGDHYDVPPLPEGEEGEVIYGMLFDAIAGATIVDPIFPTGAPMKTREREVERVERGGSHHASQDRSPRKSFARVKSQNTSCSTSQKPKAGPPSSGGTSTAASTGFPKACGGGAILRWSGPPRDASSTSRSSHSNTTDRQRKGTADEHPHTGRARRLVQTWPSGRFHQAERPRSERESIDQQRNHVAQRAG